MIFLTTYNPRSLFATMYDPDISLNQLDSDLKNVSGCTNGKWPSNLTYPKKHEKLFFLGRLLR